jgi:hypothetical protein
MFIAVILLVSTNLLLNFIRMTFDCKWWKKEPVNPMFSAAGIFWLG